VLTRLDLRTATPDRATLHGLLPRAAVDVASVTSAVEQVIADVRARGEKAIREATARFDGVELTDLRVSMIERERALAELDPDVRAALGVAIDRVRAVHTAQRRTDVTTQVVPGGSVTTRWVPVRRVGLYVPGGLAMYPSSVVMNVVPAQIAGAEAIAVASPPQRETGRPDARVLAACALLGVDEVYAVGGAQAIAMFAYGGGVCEPVDLVTGPGNIYVTAAKRLVRGVVGIDAEAGPTEIAILADDSADPSHVTADLISQAEHDPSAASVPDHRLRGTRRRGRRRAGPPGTADQAQRADRDGAVGPAVGDRPRGRPRGGPGGRGRVRGRAPRDPDPGRPGVGRAGAQCRRRVRGTVLAGLPRRLLRWFEPRASHRRLRPA
jgi:histidinol dehydrogenase